MSWQHTGELFFPAHFTFEGDDGGRLSLAARDLTFASELSMPYEPNRWIHQGADSGGLTNLVEQLPNYP